MDKHNYVLITAARNEENYVEYTINSVIAQTILPKKWVIVSDESTDKTDAIVRNYAKSYSFIELVRKEMSVKQKGFASKVAAIHLGYDQLNGLDYDFIGNLDADLSFEKDYFEQILKKFTDNPRLGIGGGYIHEKNLYGTFSPRPSNSEQSVAGAVQMFRRDCYKVIGGLQPLELGGEDWRAEIMAKMAGWEVETFPEIEVLHLKRSPDARGAIRNSFRQGLLDYSFGSLPLFEFAKCIRRLKEQPYFMGALLRSAGYVWGYCSRKKMVLSEDQVYFLRFEQKQRILRALRFRI